MALDMSRNGFINKAFAKVRRNGIDESEVRRYLEEAYTLLSTLKSDNETLQAELFAYRERENVLAKSLIAAQENALRITGEAEAEAEKIIANAQSEAEMTIARAKQDAEQYREKSEQDVNSALNRLYILRDFELSYRENVRSLILEEKKRFEERFPTDELWENSEAGKEAAALAEETGKIDLDAIYNDLPQTEEDLRKLINEL
ncbi:MAG: DivIVA domain-containing protein [Christensenellaceae bacterium]|nr:DivIVA domain-containing protein [Christensenellaceae bacterium]